MQPDEEGWADPHNFCYSVVDAHGNLLFNDDQSAALKKSHAQQCALAYAAEKIREEVRAHHPIPPPDLDTPEAEYEKGPFLFSHCTCVQFQLRVLLHEFVAALALSSGCSSNTM